MRKNQSAFTLLEIMLVVSIIAVLLSVAIYRLRGSLETGKMVAVQADLQSISTQLKVYESFNGFVPTTEQGLQALVARPSTDPQPSRWTQLLDSVPKDPWRTPYIYVSPGRKNPAGYDLYSAGPDRQPDTSDDDWGGY
ncbi:type II secretion system major pseudopilin GspG [soil metagenome]|nr:type II secretion system major pseudopilin GspG [Chthoniobacterales bacterium]MDQ3414785.1 type II secretion system major pseudopilin GspG [Verrucomicrobiota bacterium]